MSSATSSWQRLRRPLVPKVLAIALLAGLWQLLVVAGVQSPLGLPLPGPGDAVAKIGDLWRSGTLAPALVNTLLRAATGYVLALLIGTVIGIAAARVPVLRAAVGSLLAGLQSLPSVVWVPIAAIFFVAGGHDENAVYFVVIMGAFPSIAMGASLWIIIHPSRPCCCAILPAILLQTPISSPRDFILTPKKYMSAYVNLPELPSTSRFI